MESNDSDLFLNTPATIERWTAAALAIEQLAQARTLEEVVMSLRACARRVAGADGIAIVLREDQSCHYVVEDAKAPLWCGQRFPAVNCVSGWAMEHRQSIAIPDVFDDARVPHEAYRRTFVRSMFMAPIGVGEPVAALGAYWSTTGHPNAEEIALLESLARAASTALENGRLVLSLERLNEELEQRVVQRTFDLERAQEGLRQKQKMEVIGQLTGNVAHDFNNLLAPIMASLDVVLTARASPDTIRSSAMVAMEAAESVKSLIERLLAFARRQPLEREPTDLAELTEGMRGLLTSTVGASIRVNLQYEENLPMISADRHQLEMAILNLVVNARDAMNEGGGLDISIWQADDQPAGLLSEKFLVLSVRDEGCGMDADTLAAATEPYFTTKAPGHGTGLGLSMVEGLANQLGGRLEIESRLNEGAEVRLWLPIADASSCDTSPKSSTIKDTVYDSDLDCNKGEVLLVEDELLVRMGTRIMLEELGYSVAEAADAESALASIERGHLPDVVITDHIMPGMTGADFALLLRTRYPQIAVMIVSGYQGVDLLAPDLVRLSKPFRQANLEACIQTARKRVRLALSG